MINKISVQEYFEKLDTLKKECDEQLTLAQENFNKELDKIQNEFKSKLLDLMTKYSP